LKETILWFFFSGVVLIVSFLTSDSDEGILKRIGSESVKIFIVFEFLISRYTFPLAAELILIPVVTVIVLMDAFARLDEKHAFIVRLTTGAQAAIGSAILLYVAWQAAFDYGTLWSLASARRILLAPLLSFSFAPLIYILLLYSTYELLFLRLRIGRDKPRDLQQYARRRLLAHLGLRLRSARAFLQSHSLDLMRIRSRDEVDALLQSVRSAPDTDSEHRESS
jgi:hypothetical protein